MPRNRLVPGVEVVAVPGRGLAVRTAEGEFLSVRTRRADHSDHTDHADQDALLSLLAGAPSAPPDEELRRVARGFEEAGYLAAPVRPPRWPAARRDVRLLGDPVLTGPLAAQLTALGALPRTAPATAVPAPVASPVPPTTIEDLLEGGPAAVVWCLDGPVPDGLWDAADRLPEHGTAWLRCHREGWQAYVEPLAAAPGDVTAAHVRARRLAATPAHRELAAYWSGPRTSGEPVRLTVPAAALLAALLADDLARWATGAPDTAGAVPARRRLRHVDLRTLAVTEHPVLPVPAVAPMPAVVPAPAAVPMSTAVPAPAAVPGPSAVPAPAVVPTPRKGG
ncbi:hypothetical protein ACIGW0_10375 [Streptomyces bikiniensis]|uniref:Uncharacterized protein n=1 Tax=Streptomyces bikiniensis TaxID=1896 RepID=A0ABW8CRJ2_STRBI